MDRSDYPGILPKLQPGQAVDVLNDRVRQVGRLNTAIADWLQERSRLEEQYAAGLRRLARKSIDNGDLGIFSVPWSTLTGSMDTLAESHSSLASKIEVDIEKPMREFASTNREMQAMSTMQGNLASMARDVEKAQQKTDKLQVKGDRAESNKVANASSDLDNARVQWDNQAPYVFESLQVLDETRLAQLQGLLTQFQTLEVDQVEKNRVAAEQCLHVLLNVEIQDEIKVFALQAVALKPNTRTASRTSIMPSPIPARGSSSQSNTLAPIPSAEQDDSVSQISSTPEPSKKGPLKGLRRLGTVMKRSSVMPKAASSSNTDSPEKKSRSGPFGRLGRSKDSYNSGLEPPMEEGSSSRRPQSPMRLGSEVLEPTRSRDEARSPSAAPQLGPVPHLNGTSSSARSPTASSFPNGSHQGDLADLEPPRPVQPEPISTPPQRDSEGFSVPPQQLDPISQAQADAEAFGERPEPALNVNIRDAPIQEEGGEAALASVAKGLQAPPPTTRRAGTIRGRRDNRNSTVISTYGSPETSTTDNTPLPALPAMEKTVGAAPVPPLATNIPVATATAPAVAQAFQAPQTEPSSSSLVQSPSGAFSSFSPLSDPTSPIRPSSRAAIASDHTGDSQSIRSGRSTASQGIKHPDLQEPGLSTSIIETVSARFENGKLTSSALIGEIALAYNASDFNSSFGHENIRIENFSSLEKVAPNPAFISQAAAKEGEYSVNLANLARGTQLAFKYQLRQDDAQSLVPILVTPACKIEPTQTSVIVSYSLHPGFSLPQGQQSITVSNVMIALTLDGPAKATQCQTKPQGTFNKERNMVYWQVGDITLSADGAPTKLLARFATDSEARGASVDARWETAGLGSALAVSTEGADPFADGTSWKPIPAVRKLTSGNYIAKS